MKSRNPLIQAIKYAYFDQALPGATATAWLKRLSEHYEGRPIDPWWYVNGPVVATEADEKQARVILNRLVNPRTRKWFVITDIAYDGMTLKEFDAEQESEARAYYAKEQAEIRGSGGVTLIEGWDRS